MLGNKKVFIDTCIIILAKSSCYISHIVLMELYMTAKNKRELAYLKKILQGFKLLETNQKIIILSTQIVEQYVLIASTYLIYNISIYTLNVKDFRYIEGLKLYDEI